MDINQVTVIIPTRNERVNIGRFLRSLPPSVRLIVVDASTDDTVAMVQTIRPENTKVIPHPGRVTIARQVGAEYARTRWLLFADADVVFDKEYFLRLEALSIDEVTTGAVFGTKGSQLEFAVYHRWFAISQHLFSKFGIPAATGSNMMVSRKAFHIVGGFDLGLPCNEDSELIWRVRRAGYDVAFDPTLNVTSFDHRRLRRGVSAKVLHSSARCFLLYFNLLPAAWRQRDWGYWASPNQDSQRI